MNYHNLIPLPLRPTLGPTPSKNHLNPNIVFGLRKKKRKGKDEEYRIWITKTEGRDLKGRDLKGKYRQVLLRIQYFLRWKGFGGKIFVFLPFLFPFPSKQTTYTLPFSSFSFLFLPFLSRTLLSFLS